MSDRPKSYQILFAELKRRQVFKVAAVYGAVTFAVLQAADIAFPRIGLPDWTITFVVALAAIGLPIAVVLAWAYETTPEGVKKTDPAASGELEAIVAQPAGRRWPIGIVALVATALLVTNIWWVFRDGAAPGDTAAEATLAQSIAVLPFINMSGDAENEYFSDGITEEILNALAQVPGLKVAARTSAFQFKGQRLDLRDVGRQLNVATILEGSVQRLGDDVRITAQLIDAETGFHLWSGKFDRRLEDIFAVEDEIARSIADTLRAPLGLAPAGRLVNRATADPEAYELYLQGQFALGQRGNSLLRGISFYERALARDPNFAAAHAGLAEAYALLPYYALGDWEADLTRAEASAHRALALDSTMARAYVALANVRRDRWDWDTAREYYERAIALAPNDAEARHQYAQYLGVDSTPEAALAQTEIYLELDPLSPILNAGRGNLLMLDGRYEEAIRALNRGAELDPNLGIIQLWLMWAYIMTDRFDDAEAAVRRSATLVGIDPGTDAALVRAVQNPAARGEGLSILATAEDDQWLSPIPRAMWYVLLGENQLALDALALLPEPGLGNVLSVRVPILEPLHGDPRYQAILARLNLTP
jgi:TolB-like protein/Flp pilus assembly protein TadD